MRNETPFNINDETGEYTATRPLSADDILLQAWLIRKEQVKRGTKIGSPTETKEYLKAELGAREREAFGALFLDTRHRVLEFEILFYGTIDGATVYPREIIKRALQLNAAAIICSHNHPSGECEPSLADQAITRRIKEALAMVEIRLLDHLVVSPTDVVSMAERGML